MTLVSHRIRSTARWRRATMLTAIALLSACRGPSGGFADSTAAWFVRVIADSVSATAGLPALAHTNLPAGTRRELRAYIGFGLTVTHEMYRIWQDDEGVHGWAGLWWDGERPRSRSEAGIIQDQENQRAYVASLREYVSRRGCVDVRQLPAFETCTMPTAHVDWRATLRSLDDLGVARLGAPRSPEGTDGTTLLVEHRDRRRYRAYSYWTPSDSAADPNERAASAIMDLLQNLSGR